MAINTAGTTTASISAGTRIANPDIGVFLDFEADTLVTFKDPNHTTISITELPIENTPMPLPEGVIATKILTIQPAGATFSPPPRVTFRNNDNIAAGTRGVALYRFDHDTGDWLQFDTGTVSADGASVIGDNVKTALLPGMIESGWNGPVLTIFCTTTVSGRVIDSRLVGIPFVRIITTNGVNRFTDISGNYAIPGVPVPFAGASVFVTAFPGFNSGFGALRLCRRSDSM